MSVKLILDNGMVFEGEGLGCNTNTAKGEIIFNTSMVGYQEIITDPNNYGKIIVMAYPLMGNYGLTDDDNQSQNIQVAGLVVSEQNDNPSNFRFTTTLNESLQLSGTPGISGVDTRALVKLIAKSEKPIYAMITTKDIDVKEAMKELENIKGQGGEVQAVTCKRVLYMRTRNPKYNVVVVDCGLKTSVRKELNALSCNLIVVPFNTSCEDILKYNPDGVLFSNGPGNPKENECLISLAKELKGKVPMLGIGLGFQILCLSYGFDTKRRAVSVSGSSVPVKDLKTNKVLVTSQYTSYRVVEKDVEGLEVIYKSIRDGFVEGIEDEQNEVIAIQFEPNSTGDKTGADVLNRFVEYMAKHVGDEGGNINKY
ncbi:MAG TPA: carbamoyl phosphate synthase small subunit [Clostridia bacterium]|jgi:carbamoyl-phosphate synthase small subunit|nr:carbamoyl phosphate synthase small subunit [Clostridia bacterium]